jgi:RNA polymerase sigma factor (sigma-70 family)
MTARPGRGILRRLPGTEADPPDADLLADFVARRDEAAFAAIVRRHGPMVLGVCRRVTGDPHDADDAFQATFLVLATRAGSLRAGGGLGGWLHGVAYRTARRLRATRCRRRSKETPMSRPPQPAAGESRDDLLPLLDEELARLPDLYRVPTVLCELEGRPRKEVARLLGIPEGTLSSRLAAGRKRLAERLTRRGVAGAAAALSIAVRDARAAIPTPVLTSTARAAARVASGQAAGALVPARVADLATGVLKSMFLTRLKVGAALLLAAGCVGVALAVPVPADDPKPPPKDKTAPLKGVAPAPAAGAESAALLGTWKVVSVRTADAVGVVRRPDYTAAETAFAGATWTITDDTILVQLGDEKRESKYRRLPSAKPPALDVTPPVFPAAEKDGTSRAIYRVDGDRLTVCFAPPGADRPADFNRPGTGFVFVIELRRVAIPVPAPAGRPVEPVLDKAYLAALDAALSRAVVDRARKHGLTSTRPVLDVVARLLPDDPGVKVALEAMRGPDLAGDPPQDLTDVLADFAHRYRMAAVAHQAPAELTDVCRKRTEGLAGAYRALTGKDVAAYEERDRGIARRAVDRVNEYRKRAGLKPVELGAATLVRPTLHAIFLDLARVGARPGAPFGEGQPANRQAEGRPGACLNGDLLAQSSLVGFGPADELVERWMASFPTRCVLLRPRLESLFVAHALSAGTRPDRSDDRVCVVQYSFPAGAETEPAPVVFPEPGATGVPTRLWEEWPSMLPADAPRDKQGRAVAGFPVTATFWGADSVTGAAARLLRRDGAGWAEVPAFVSTPENPAASDVWVANLGSIVVVAKEPLRPNTDYRAEFRATVNGKPGDKVTEFRTGDDRPRPESMPVPFAVGPNDRLAATFRVKPGLLLASEAAFAVKRDAAFADALDLAFYRAVLWRARWEEREGDVSAWRPVLALAAGLVPGRTEAAEMAKGDAMKPLPADALDLVADYAARYREAADAADTAPAVRDRLKARGGQLAAFYQAHGGRGADDMAGRVGREADRAVTRLNEYRKRLGLAPVSLDARLSRACQRQALYVDLNRGEGKDAWTFKGAMTPHEAVPGQPGYCEAAALAGMTSVVAFSTPSDCVDGWMTSFFHRIPLLNPEARAVGVGFALSGDAFARGTGKIALLSVPAIWQKPSRPTVVTYPEPGAKGVPLVYGVESPDAVAKPEKRDRQGLTIAGFPITATFFGSEKVTKAEGRLFVRNGEAWDEVPTYFSSPEAPAQPRFPDNLKTLCLLAKDRLRPRTSYKAAFRAVVDGKPWEAEVPFETAADRAADR